MSFEGYMVNRDESPAVEFEATFANHYVAEEVRSASNEGFDVEDLGSFGSKGVRIVYVRHDDGRPWIYREFHVVEPLKEPRREYHPTGAWPLDSNHVETDRRKH